MAKAKVVEKSDRAKRQAAAADVIDVGVTTALLPAVSDDEKFVEAAGQGVLGLLKSLRTFFSTANAMEKDAKDRLAHAVGLAAPKTPDDDELMQRFVKDTNEQKKLVEDHWKVTAVISGFHRRMTAARARATDPLDRAASIGNQFHQAFKEKAEREARLEQDRLRREAEEQALRDRQAELDKLETDAVKAEEGSPKLSEREQHFVDLYTDRSSLGYDNGQRAAKMAGFKGANLVAVAGRLLSLDKIRVAIEAKTKAREIRQQAVAAAQAPVTANVPTVLSVVQKASGTRERTYYSAELLDEKALIDAICEGRLGIPRDLLRVHQPTLNRYAEDMKDLINRWPGARLKKETKVQ